MAPEKRVRLIWPGSARRGGILAILLLYAVFAVGWFALPDRLLHSPWIVRVGMLKDWVFVAAMSVLLYGLLGRWFGNEALPKTAPAGSKRFTVVFAALSAVIVMFTVAAVIHGFERQKERLVNGLRIIAELESRRVADWLMERRIDADFVQTSGLFAYYVPSRQLSDGQQHNEGLQQLEALRRILGFDAVLWLDSNGESLASSGRPSRIIDSTLQAAVRTALVERKIRRVGPFIDEEGHANLNYDVPLADGSGPASVLMVQMSLTERIDKLLQTLPVDKPGSGIVVFRAYGDQVIYLRRFHSPQHSTIRPGIKTEAGLRAGQPLTGDIPVGRPVEGLDDRGIPVIGVAQALAGKDSLLLAKIENSPVYAGFVSGLSMMCWLGIVVLVTVWVGFYLKRGSRFLASVKTEQQAQAERLNGLDLFAAIADCSDDAIFAKDTEGRYLQFNNAARRFVDKPVDQILGHDDRDIFPAGQAEILMAIDRRIIAENRITSQEESLDTVVGARIFHTTKGPLRDAEGNVIGVFGIARDITVRKQAELALRESESRFRALVEQSLAGIYIIQDNYFKYVNPRFAAIFGYDAPADLIDRVTVADLVVPEDREKVLDNIQRRIAREVENIHYTFTGLRRDGSWIDIEVHGCVFDFQNRPAVIGLLLDITLRKAAEAALHRQTEELAQRNAELERFNRAMVRRELDMIAFKQQVNRLSEQLGQEAPYDLSFLDRPIPDSSDGDVT